MMQEYLYTAVHISVFAQWKGHYIKLFQGIPLGNKNCRMGVSSR